MSCVYAPCWPWVTSARLIQRHKPFSLITYSSQICPGLNANEIQIPHGKHH